MKFTEEVTFILAFCTFVTLVVEPSPNIAAAFIAALTLTGIALFLNSKRKEGIEHLEHDLKKLEDRVNRLSLGNMRGK